MIVAPFEVVVEGCEQQAERFPEVEVWREENPVRYSEPFIHAPRVGVPEGHGNDEFVEAGRSIEFALALLGHHRFWGDDEDESPGRADSPRYPRPRIERPARCQPGPPTAACPGRLTLLGAGRRMPYRRAGAGRTRTHRVADLPQQAHCRWQSTVRIPPQQRVVDMYGPASPAPALDIQRKFSHLSSWSGTWRLLSSETGLALASMTPFCAISDSARERIIRVPGRHSPRKLPHARIKRSICSASGTRVAQRDDS